MYDKALHLTAFGNRANRSGDTETVKKTRQNTENKQTFDLLFDWNLN